MLESIFRDLLLALLDDRLGSLLAVTVFLDGRVSCPAAVRSASGIESGPRSTATGASLNTGWGVCSFCE